MSKLILSLGLVLLITACATPQPPAQTTAAAATDSQTQMVVSRGTQATGDQLVCSTDYPMGSHIPQRICLTKEQMAARQKAAQEAMQNMQSQGKESSCAPSCL
ncbi:MAG: hypothetical protein WBR15_00800 [Gammaproteobacteria bacterium]